MHNESYEVVTIVLPEEAAEHAAAVPRTVLVRLYESDCRSELDRAIQKFIKAENPASHYRTIPVGSTEDFVEYWIEFATDATEFAGRLRRLLSSAVSQGKRARRVSLEGGTGLRPGGLAA